ncbi:phospholipase B1, membrane-associated [Ceratitis capitata]|uniref:Phospholipase B1, membrane-associated n=1 Tax=Ceratitis capitata TaxID=7213 RepID=W8BV54_CERCA|nr:phospholipase B1, membrane-associated [Ceratitis capitata]XP_020713360.1 phospholipase B1, membrane-associated [Ceratitis capitata]XP_020713361.1 phospholipase B1, membrane-associated [Ceratitis capitata]
MFHPTLKYCLLLGALSLHMYHPVLTQRTSLDVTFRDLYRPLRLLGLNFAGRSGDNPDNRQLVRDMGKTQNLNTRARSLVNFCDALNGPGKRSERRPNSVHRLRPGDIDVIGAMGDSLTAGNGIFATNLLHVTVENRGMVWSIGGQGTWRQYLTLPNILKEFNPNLYGYSLKDGLSTDRSSKFNVAELGAMSRDIPYEAQVLVKRMSRDPKVNMTEDWKLITMLIGNNDFCSDVCYLPRPEDAIKKHEENMVKTYRYLRDNVPRLMINVVPSPKLDFLVGLSMKTPICHTTLSFECPCLVGKPKQHVNRMKQLMKKWIEKDREIVNRDEFNTETFTINMQPFTLFGDFFPNSDDAVKFKFLSEDCFHLSQRGHAISANYLWNNMLEPNGEKSIMDEPTLMEKFHCPTEQRPYLMTRVNSDRNFLV